MTTVDVWEFVAKGEKLPVVTDIHGRSYSVSFQFHNTLRCTALLLIVYGDGRRWCQVRAFDFWPFVPAHQMKQRYDAQVEEFCQWLRDTVAAHPDSMQQKLDAWAHSATPNRTNAFLKQPVSVFQCMIYTDVRAL